MKISELNQRIKIKQKEIKKDEIGKETEVWKVKKEVWAKVKNIFGKEYFLAKQVNLEKSLKVTIRFLKDLNEDMIIEFNDEDYDIENVENIKLKNKWLELTVKKER